MGRATRWFRNIFRLKKSNRKPDTNPDTSQTVSDGKCHRRFVNSGLDNDFISQNHRQCSTYEKGESRLNRYEYPDTHEIEVAVATAAAADAAVKAAQAAAAVVRLTSYSGTDTRYHPAQVSNSYYGNYSYVLSCEEEESAAVKIQSAFRGYLARRALRALRGLVRLQALVRGNIVRKRTSEWMRRMQALLRSQTRARSARSIASESPKSSTKSYHSHYHNGPQTIDQFEHVIRSCHGARKKKVSKPNAGITHDFWNLSDAQMDELWQDRSVSSSVLVGTVDDEKILEIDTGGRHHRFKPKPRNLFHSSPLVMVDDDVDDQNGHSYRTTTLSRFDEVQMKYSGYPPTTEESPYCMAYNSPHVCSVSSKGVAGSSSSAKRSPFTPTKSDGGSTSYLTGYSDYPSYMAYTESSKAKLRSLSAPRQRPQHYERSSSATRYSLYGFGEFRSQNVSTMHAGFTSKEYPGSGRLDNLGMPVGF